MPWADAEHRVLPRDRQAGIRWAGLAVCGLGVLLALAPTLLWPGAAGSAPAVHVEAVTGSSLGEPTPAEALPDAARTAFASGRAADGPTAVPDPETVAALRRHPYVAHDGGTYRLAIYYGAGTELGGTVTATALVAIGITGAMLGWLAQRQGSLRTLTPQRGLILPVLVSTLVWLLPTPGGLGDIPPALGLAIAGGTLALPAGVVANHRGHPTQFVLPVLGLGLGGGLAIAIGANPGRIDEVLLAIAVVTLPWYVLGSMLARPTTRG